MRLYAETTTAGTAAYQYRQLLRMCSPASHAAGYAAPADACTKQELCFANRTPILFAQTAKLRNYTKRLLK